MDQAERAHTPHTLTARLGIQVTTDPFSDRLELEADITFVGTAGCGKTSLLLTGLRNGGLNDSDRGTSVWKSYSGTFTTSSHIVRLNVWDTPGMEEYKASRELGYTEG
ncbi:hypothetical protein FRC12_003373 [Ceratobasidium sp. 428]|nr:hypothetical protein FRC12_003373 [Ceratobasidium sp. 428]